MHLIVFCDGTWNTPDQMDGGLPAPTNVVKLRNALASTDAGGNEQRIYYHTGVGTDGTWWNRIAGGGLGEGLNKNIMSAYNWLARNYQAGAKIWLFGFSRGAYTARSLGGMISRCGLLDPVSSKMSESEIWAAIEDLFANYKLPEKEAPPVVATKARQFHKVNAGAPCKHSINIECIGVWDTVGALGVPEDMALLSLIDGAEKYRFHDTGLSDIVVNARHAMAMDEKRQSFLPTLWTNVADKATVKQIWFPGVHADVGGGYGLCGLSDGALQWMIDETQQLGLRFRDGARGQLAPNPMAQLHDSVTGVFKNLKTRPRSIPLVNAASLEIHQSAIDRWANPPLSQGDYWKPTSFVDGTATVEIFASQHWNYTGIYLEAGVEYTFTATGEWIDGSIPCGPDGQDDGKFHLGVIAQMGASLLGKGEGLYTKLTGNHQADFWYTKREENAPWFALVGVIANGAVATDDPERLADFPPHEVVLIGKSAKFSPKASGYLYAFANDAWQMYANNRGSVRLTVESS